jgi:hypothetical protein
MGQFAKAHQPRARTLCPCRHLHVYSQQVIKKLKPTEVYTNFWIKKVTLVLIVSIQGVHMPHMETTVTV